MSNNVPRLVSPKEAAAMTTLTRVTLANMAADGIFPAPVRLSERRIAFVRDEVVAWIESRMSTRVRA